jgi:N-acetylglucosaminyldiphosphoundecaprenol N-acetyl-beta-D-mannosaminyltransferase
MNDNIKRSNGTSPEKQWEIFDVPLFCGDKPTVLRLIDESILSGRKKFRIATVNPEFIMLSLRDEDFHQLLKKTDLNVIDGIGLIWANEIDKRYVISRRGFFRKFFGGLKIGAKILHGRYNERLVSGSDLIVDLNRLAAEKSLKIFFLGGFENRAEKTANYFKLKFDLKPEQLCWCSGDPEFTNEEILEKINRFKPDILFVAYAMKKQEFWITQNKNHLDAGVMVGVGRSFDYYSGNLKRAPQVWRRIGMEWLYSLIKEPKRWRRQLALPKFVWRVLTAKK